MNSIGTASSVSQQQQAAAGLATDCELQAAVLNAHHHFRQSSHS